jgi:methionyl-tRNA synthetase
MSARRQILVTSALPYANGPIHIGHLVEYIQTDVWVRYQRLAGHDVTYVCASDAHGTPVMLKAREQGVSPEELVERFRAEHRRDFAAFHVAFDNFHSTHSPENQALTEGIFATLDQRGHITRRTIAQAYDEAAGMFLPDRFVRGTCPSCGAADQYGDSCEACGATYSPADLVNPRSVVSGTAPVERESEHLFFRLGDFTDSLRRWHAAGHLDEGAARKLGEWFEGGLKDWDISRDAPYFGFAIPGHPGKYFYVWLDAPVGYMASFRNYCDSPAGRARGLDFAAYWGPSSEAELYHFIGKDILYFHTLFWPAVLEGAGYRRPTAVHVHGFLTVNGQKMSKSRGTFVAAATWLRHLDPEALRYYYAFKLGPGLDDLDLNLDDFAARVNADLVGKFVNLASRCAGFIQRLAGGRLAAALDEPAVLAEAVAAGDRIGAHYAAREYSRACREVMALADAANRYIDARKPWVLAKDPARQAEVQAICTTGINLFRVLMTYLQPVLPAMADRACRFLAVERLGWAERATPLLDRAIGTYEPLLTRVDPAAITAMLEASMEKPAPSTATATTPPPAAPAAPAATGTAEIDLAEFQKVDLRIATVLAAEAVEGADKLVRLTLDIGTGTRTVLSGIKAAYPPEKLVGRQVILVANLKPRKMRFGVSEGMVLAASGEAGLFLVGPDSGATAGMQVS